jgi:hypothetical protein
MKDIEELLKDLIKETDPKEEDLKIALLASRLSRKVPTQYFKYFKLLLLGINNKYDKVSLSKISFISRFNKLDSLL